MATPQLGSNLGEGVHKVVSVCMFKATLVLLLAIAVAAVVFLMADTDQTNTTLKTPKPVEGLPKKLRAIVIGGTGEIGRHLVTELVNSDNWEKVTTIGRRKAPEGMWPKSDKINEVVFPLDDLKKDENKKYFEGHDVAFCTLGTTRADAGSAEAFMKVDYEYVANFAEQAKTAGTRDFHLVTSVGANKNSWFLFPRTKGMAEDFVSKLGFHNTFIYRPPLLGRSQPRTTEKLARLFTKPMPVEHIGYCMRDIAERAFLSDTQPNNTRIIDSKQLWGMMDYAK